LVFVSREDFHKGSNSQSECDPVGRLIGGGLGLVIGESIAVGIGGTVLSNAGQQFLGGNC
jgi:hypothetical protein